MPVASTVLISFSFIGLLEVQIVRSDLLQAVPVIETSGDQPQMSSDCCSARPASAFEPTLLKSL